MKRCRVEKVFVEMQRLHAAITALYDVDKSYGGCNPRETGAVRRASMDLTRALSDLRKTDYIALPGEK